MNRRGFFGTLAKAVAGFTILPAAMTYARTWVPTENLWVPNPAYACADYEYVLILNSQQFVGAMAKALSEHSPWLDVVKGGKFPEGASFTRRDEGSTVIYSRTPVLTPKSGPAAVDS